MNEETKIHLKQFLDFLLKEGYCDADVYAEPPTAIDQYMAKHPEYFPIEQLEPENVDLEVVNKAIEKFKASEKWDEVDPDEEEGFPIGFQCGVEWLQSITAKSGNETPPKAGIGEHCGKLYRIECLTEDGDIECNGYFFNRAKAESAKSELDKQPRNTKYGIIQAIIEIEIEDAPTLNLPTEGEIGMIIGEKLGVRMYNGTNARIYGQSAAARAIIKRIGG